MVTHNVIVLVTERQETHFVRNLILFYLLSCKIDIEWVVDEYKRNVAVVPCKRINIAEYTKNSDGKYVKKEISEEKYKLSTDKHLYFKYGKHYYEKETREWGFKQSRLNK